MKAETALLLIESLQKNFDWTMNKFGHEKLQVCLVKATGPVSLGLMMDDVFDFTATDKQTFLEDVSSAYKDIMKSSHEGI